jgi:hypothetical protein
MSSASSGVATSMSVSQMTGIVWTGKPTCADTRGWKPPGAGSRVSLATMSLTEWEQQ